MLIKVSDLKCLLKLNTHVYIFKYLNFPIICIHILSEKEWTRQSVNFMPSHTELYRILFWFSTGIIRANILILTTFITCPMKIIFLKMAYTYYIHIYIYTCTHIYIRVSMHTCEYISLLSQQKRLYSDFKQNFTSTVESHVLILKPTITLSWFFFSKWFFHNSMKQPLQRQGSDIWVSLTFTYFCV